MAHLLDSSMFLRHTNLSDALYPAAAHAIGALHERGEILHTAPQIFTEFRSVATRLVEVNGLGLPAAEVAARAAVYEAVFPILLETPDIFPA